MYRCSKFKFFSIKILLIAILNWNKYKLDILSEKHPEKSNLLVKNL
jgi:hypothetical protein